MSSPSRPPTAQAQTQAQAHARPSRAIARGAAARATTRSGARNGGGQMLALRRCLHCGGDLSMLRPALETSVAVAEIVARQALDGRQTTSAHVAECLGVTPTRAAGQLLRALRDGLVTRTRLYLPHGGYRWVYWPDARAVAYVRQTGLALALRERLFTPRT